MKYKYIIKNTETKRFSLWPIKKVLAEVNRSCLDERSPYNSRDWKEGWKHWVKGDDYCSLRLVGRVRVN
jgi:hypothetical protein